MAVYTYKFFMQNDNQPLKTLLNITGDYSLVPIEKLFPEIRSANENRLLGSLIRGNSNNDSTGAKTLEHLLSKSVLEIWSYRNIGRGSQELLFSLILKYFNFGEMTSEIELRRSNRKILKDIIDEGQVSIEQLLFELFDEVNVNLQEKFMSKYR